MIAACLLALAVHPLLNYDPPTVIGNDEAVQIKIEAILHGGAVSRQTPEELVSIGERVGFDGLALAKASRLVAKERHRSASGSGLRMPADPSPPVSLSRGASSWGACRTGAAWP